MKEERVEGNRAYINSNRPIVIGNQTKDGAKVPTQEIETEGNLTSS